MPDYKEQPLVLRAFCEALPGGYSMLNDQRDRPDGEISGPCGEKIGVELARYVAADKDRERDVRNDALCTAFQSKWIENGLGAYSPTVAFKRDRSGRQMVPGNKEREAFLHELVSVVQAHTPNDPDTASVLHVRPDLDDGESLPSTSVSDHIAIHAGATIDRCCSKIIIHYHPENPHDRTLHTSMSQGFGFVDTAQIVLTITNHAEMVPTYRANLGGQAPVWLVMHCNGWHLSKLLLDVHIPTAVNAGRAALTEIQGDNFDAAFLFNCPTAWRGGTLHPMDEGSEAVLGG